jgi:hypothetical protein
VRITLNKAFGFELIDADVLPFLLAAATVGPVDVPLKDGENEVRVRVGLGQYGRTHAEKRVLHDTALRKYEFDDISPVPSLRIRLNYTLSEAAVEAAKSEATPGKAALALDDEIRRIVPLVKHATDRYYSGYRHFALSEKLGSTHTWDQIAYEQEILEPLMLRELSTYLFYEVRTEAGIRFGRALGSTQLYSSVPLGDSDKRRVKRTIRHGVEFPDALFAEALVHLYFERYREAYLNLAIALEIALSAWVRRKMLATGSLSRGQVDRFIEDMSNRELITVMVGYISRADNDLLADGKQVFEIRNGLAHGRKRAVSGPEVKKALGVVYRFRELFDAT